MDKQQLASTVNKVLDEMRQRPIPIGISSRHIHLAAADYARLFPAQPIQPKKALLQPVAHCMRRWPGAFGYS
ncbi:propanediol utilization protein PduL [Klebsiella pneumoniae]|nr:propanediol utilization protein PduL [Klebsiella pneumoniae]STS11137.1 propanediol utilization protein PduL [Klebsiella pneumoniae]STS18510.1 propanediol utilization protein PduL [Klebsiella pneumoniae]STS39798.1 propanediol utilization protein PduL [Klebsiella pneumoniae]STS54234.1 propanediol utilization protein PduL [Klebsiella pneumoniae]